MSIEKYVKDKFEEAVRNKVHACGYDVVESLTLPGFYYWMKCDKDTGEMSKGEELFDNQEEAYDACYKENSLADIDFWKDAKDMESLQDVVNYLNNAYEKSHDVRDFRLAIEVCIRSHIFRDC